MTVYQPRHDTQFEPRDQWSPVDCNMAAAADAARFYSLGLIDHSHTYFRKLTGDTEGGTNISEAHDALEKAGVHVAATYDAPDGKSWGDVAHELNLGRVVIAHGDYGSIPRSERGELSPSFTGTHSVLFTRIATVAEDLQVRVADGLSEAYEWWTVSDANAYMRDFPGAGYTFLSVAPRHVAARVTKANVRASASTAAAIVGTISPTSRIHMGGTVIGGAVGANRTWYRVWFKDRIAYVHTSVAKIA